MELNRKYLYVVEGKSDVDKLKKVGCEYVIEVGGKYIRNEIISFLKKVKEKRNIVLVLDPDGPGRQIETYLNEHLGVLLSVHINKKEAISYKKSKVGIAETSNENIKKYLINFINHDNETNENKSLLESDLIDYLYASCNKKHNKDKIIETYSIPYKTFKNIYECLLLLSVSKEDLKELLNE